MRPHCPTIRVVRKLLPPSHDLHINKMLVVPALKSQPHTCPRNDASIQHPFPFQGKALPEAAKSVPDVQRSHSFRMGCSGVIAACLRTVSLHCPGRSQPRCVPRPTQHLDCPRRCAVGKQEPARTGRKRSFRNRRSRSLTPVWANRGCRFDRDAQWGATQVECWEAVVLTRAFRAEDQGRQLPNRLPVHVVAVDLMEHISNLNLAGSLSRATHSEALDMQRSCRVWLEDNPHPNGLPPRKVRPSDTDSGLKLPFLEQRAAEMRCSDYGAPKVRGS
mmetsp:Transcript_47876/g.95923  ORF Transcript_47876/g.95923 Transcript_47876/m.95923 type:complete len:275 (-) Transcript_47876:78-902(-)